jgi:hypothetical protein
MVGDLLSGQEHAQQILDLPQAQAHGEGGHGQSPLLGRVTTDQAFGLAPEFDDHLSQPLILGAEFGHRFGDGLGGEPPLDLAGVLVDGLAATAGLFGLPGDGAVATREDGSGVEDPGADG